MSEIINYDQELSNGNYLFKFCPFNINALQILINNTLHFSHPIYFNDPLESRFRVQLNKPENFSKKTKDTLFRARFNLNDRIKYLSKNAGLYIGEIDLIQQFFEEYVSHHHNTYLGICCFTGTGEENLLWSHYADEAKGICFVFDKHELIKSIKSNNNDTRYSIVSDKVKYLGAKPIKVQLFKNGKIKFYYNHIFSKTSHWKYEKEFRMLLLQKTRKANDYIPDEFDPYLKFNPDCLKYIITGERISKEHHQMLYYLIRESSRDIKIINHTYSIK